MEDGYAGMRNYSWEGRHLHIYTKS